MGCPLLPIEGQRLSSTTATVPCVRCTFIEAPAPRKGKRNSTCEILYGAVSSVLYSSQAYREKKFIGSQIRIWDWTLASRKRS